MFLTFDLDWADDEALDRVVKLLRQYACKATFFVTHDSPVVAELRADGDFECGIHPHFHLTGGDTGLSHPADAETVVRNLKQMVPEAVSVRSHMLLQGTLLSKLFAQHGLMIDCNPYIPFRRAGPIRPWRFWTGMLVVPFVWSDYIDFLQMGETELLSLLDSPDVTSVVAFHPIHIYLNSRSVADYDDFLASGLSASEFARGSRRGLEGVGYLFETFLKEIRARGIKTRLVRELLQEGAGHAGRQGRCDVTEAT